MKKKKIVIFCFLEIIFKLFLHRPITISFSIQSTFQKAHFPPGSYSKIEVDPEDEVAARVGLLWGLRLI